MTWRGDLFKVTLTMMDSERHKARESFYATGDLPGNEFAQVAALAQYVIGLQKPLHPLASTDQDLSGCDIVSINITRAQYEDTQANGSTAYEDVEDKSVFLFKDSLNKTTRISIPGNRPEMQIAQGPYRDVALDLDYADMGDWVDVCINGYDTNPLGFAGMAYIVSADGERLLRLAEAYKQQSGSQASNKYKG